MTVTPPPPPLTLSALTLSTSTVNGGAISKGTVTLSFYSRKFGVVVDVASGIAAVASVPASVTVAAGASSASFTLTG